MFNQPQHKPRRRHFPPVPIRQPQTFPQAPIPLEKRLTLPHNAGVPLHGPVYAASMQSLLGPVPGSPQWGRSIAGPHCRTQQGLPHRKRLPLKKGSVDGEQHSRSVSQDLGVQQSKSIAQDRGEQHSRSVSQDIGVQHSRSVSQDIGVQQSRSIAEDPGEQQEPDLKRQTVNRSDKSGQVTHEVSESAGAVLLPGQEEAADHSCVEAQITVAELQVNRPSLKVTIQRCSESREFLQGGSATDKPCEGLHCHLCNVTFSEPQYFRGHMMGVEHQRRLMDIQRISSVCLRRHWPSIQRWCATCQSHFSGDLILHRRTNQHKVCKQASRPFCSVCKRHFRTPKKFVEHMKSPDHKQQQQQLCQEDTLEEELITVDAVGCFEEECP